MKIVMGSRWKKVGIVPGVFLIAALFVAAPAPSEELYDLCYRTYPLRDGKVLFVRYRNPLLEPVLRNLELHLFDPSSAKISFLLKSQEKLYLLPVVSRDRSTMVYHSLIEGNDFLMTSNLETGRSSRLRFDTGGYFLGLGLDYDNDTVAAFIKRGESKQAIYIISNRRGSIRRIFNGTNFKEVGFLETGDVFYVDTIRDKKVLGIAWEKKAGNFVIAEEIDYFQKSPRGDAIIYSRGQNLFLFNVNGRVSVPLSKTFDVTGKLPVFSQDGSTCAVYEKESVNIVNVPSGDIFYFISIDTSDIQGILTDFTIYISKGNKIYYLKHKMPGQALAELCTSEWDISILGVSPDDRYVVFKNEPRTELTVYDIDTGEFNSRELTFAVQDIVYALKGTSFYLITRTEDPNYPSPLQELYLYDFKAENLFIISAASNADVKLYRRKE